MDTLTTTNESFFVDKIVGSGGYASRIGRENKGDGEKKVTVLQY